MDYTFHDVSGAEITKTLGVSVSKGSINKSLLGHLGDDLRLPEQRVLLVLKLDLGSAELWQEDRVSNLKAGINLTYVELYTVCFDSVFP